MIKLIVFDFDGVIGDSFPEAKKIFDSLKKEKPKLKDFDFEMIRQLGVREALKRSNVSLIYALYLITRIQKKYSEQLSDVPLIPGMDKVIRELSKKYKLAILSTNRKENILAFLEKNKLPESFDVVHTVKGFFSKHRSIRKIMKDYSVKSHEILYVGDEDRDVESMKKEDIKTISVVWGYNSEELLRKVNPYFIAKEPKDILRLIRKIDKKDNNSG